MSKIYDPKRDDERRGVDQDIKGEKEAAIEKALARLIEGGYLKPESMEAEEASSGDQKPSDEARRIGTRVRQRVLAQLGLPNLGAYLIRERKTGGLAQSDVARACRLTRQVVNQLETGALPFFMILPGKAADVVQTLKLDPGIVLFYLNGVDVAVAQHDGQASNAFYRTSNKQGDAGKKAPTSTDSGATLSQQDRLDQFLREFKDELAKRGLIK